MWIWKRVGLVFLMQTIVVKRLPVFFYVSLVQIFQLCIFSFDVDLLNYTIKVVNIDLSWNSILFEWHYVFFTHCYQCLDARQKKQFLDSFSWIHVIMLKQFFLLYFFFQFSRPNLLLKHCKYQRCLIQSKVRW